MPRIWQRMAVVSATLLAALVLAPTGAYLAYRFPDWYVMYTLPLSTWPSWQQLALGAAPALLAPLAAMLSALLLQRRLVTLAWSVMALGAAGTAGILVWGGNRLWWVGSAEAFSSETRSLMPQLGEHRLLAGMIIMLAGLGACWLWTLHTLRRQRRAMRASPGGDTIVPG
ncbi:MAG: hypothetical protein ABIJ09_04185 [Pseudomonadota bacterium]